MVGWLPMTYADDPLVTVMPVPFAMELVPTFWRAPVPAP